MIAIRLFEALLLRQESIGPRSVETARNATGQVRCTAYKVGYRARNGRRRRFLEKIYPEFS